MDSQNLPGDLVRPSSGLNYLARTMRKVFFALHISNHIHWYTKQSNVWRLIERHWNIVVKRVQTSAVSVIASKAIPMYFRKYVLTCS